MQPISHHAMSLIHTIARQAASPSPSNIPDMQPMIGPLPLSVLIVLCLFSFFGLTIPFVAVYRLFIKPHQDKKKLKNQDEEAASKEMELEMQVQSFMGTKDTQRRVRKEEQRPREGRIRWRGEEEEEIKRGREGSLMEWEVQGERDLGLRNESEWQDVQISGEEPVRNFSRKARPDRKGTLQKLRPQGI
ncbi:hypothetical protein EJ04DRAFT_606953 [Polyplosphaeria fusca]|uniref:Uncharacterized protein n=1 Tax=Polyplosphaeria fusca TaxID=682080 RepID=A0A9P4UZZ1_9PLEO|nr:hypothetical protein EJ04DRAFT_606953 [Polyplosphaeria fusca]